MDPINHGPIGTLVARVWTLFCTVFSCIIFWYVIVCCNSGLSLYAVFSCIYVCMYAIVDNNLCHSVNTYGQTIVE